MFLTTSERDTIVTKHINIRAILIILATALVLLSLSTATWAWYSSTINSKAPAKMQAGNEAVSYDVQIGTVAAGGDESAREFVECKNGVLGIDQLEQTDGVYSIAMNQLKFGVVDNLSRYKPENIVYLKIGLHKTDGKTVKVKLYHEPDANGYFFDIYRTIDAPTKLDPSVDEDKAILDGILNVQTEAERDNQSLVQFSYAFAKDSNIIPHEQAFETTTPVMRQTDPTADPEGVTLTCTNEWYNELADDATYYLYIKITPNLDSFALTIDHLNTIMPCYLLFQMSFSIERIIEEEVSQ